MVAPHSQASTMPVNPINLLASQVSASSITAGMTKSVHPSVDELRPIWDQRVEDTGCLVEDLHLHHHHSVPHLVSMPSHLTSSSTPFKTLPQHHRGVSTTYSVLSPSSPLLPSSALHIHQPACLDIEAPGVKDPNSLYSLVHLPSPIKERGGEFKAHVGNQSFESDSTHAPSVETNTALMSPSSSPYFNSQDEANTAPNTRWYPAHCFHSASCLVDSAGVGGGLFDCLTSGREEASKQARAISPQSVDNGSLLLQQHLQDASLGGDMLRTPANCMLGLYAPAPPTLSTSPSSTSTNNFIPSSPHQRVLPPPPPPPHPNSEDGYTIRIKNLPSKARSPEVENLLKQYTKGNHVAAEILFHEKPFRSKGHARVSYQTHDDAEVAIGQLKDKWLTVANKTRQLTAEHEWPSSKVRSSKANSGSPKNKGSGRKRGKCAPPRTTPVATTASSPASATATVAHVHGSPLPVPPRSLRPFSTANLVGVNNSPNHPPPPSVGPPPPSGVRRDTTQGTTAMTSGALGCCCLAGGVICPVHSPLALGPGAAKGGLSTPSPPLTNSSISDFSDLDTFITAESKLQWLRLFPNPMDNVSLQSSTVSANRI